MARSFFNIWVITTVIICPIPIIKIAKIDLNCCQIVTKPQKYCQILIIFCQSGKISLNLVTLRQHKDILILNSLPEIREIPPRLPPSPFHLQISSFKDIENFLL